MRRIGVMPTAGSLVPESGMADIREILVGNYRIIYQVRDAEVRVHGAQLLSQDRIDSAMD